MRDRFKPSRAGGQSAGLRVSTAGTGFVLTAALLASTAARADIVIGVAAPFSGPFADQGRAIKSGAEAAIAAINADGGVGGERLVLETVDDGCAPTRAADAAQTLIARKPALALGHPCSAAAIAAAKLYARQPLTFIAVGPRHPELTERRAGANVWRLAGRDDRQGEVAAEFIARRFQGKPVAVVHDRTQLARARTSELISALGARGITGIPVHGIVAGERDYGALVSKLKLAGSAAVYFAGFPSEAAVILKQMRTAGVEAALVGPDALATAELTGLAADRLGHVYLTRADAAHSLADLARAGVEAWAAAAARPSVGPAGLSTKAETHIGTLAFDIKGDAGIGSFRMMRWDGAAWVPLKASE